MSPTLDELKKEAEEAYKIYKESKEKTKCLESDWLKKRDLFMKADYESAITDGRFHVIDSHKTKKQDNKDPNEYLDKMSFEQILEAIQIMSSFKI